jgi:hypothetical protein
MIPVDTSFEWPKAEICGFAKILLLVFYFNLLKSLKSLMSQTVSQTEKLSSSCSHQFFFTAIKQRLSYLDDSLRSEIFLNKV